MLAFTKRNILLYFRDKTAVFFSLFAVLILIILYVVFLGDLTAKGLPEFPAKEDLLIAWFIAGILAVTSMTTTLGALGILVEDRANQRIMDFYAAPIARVKLVMGYILSALFVGVIMCVITFGCTNIYLVIIGKDLVSFTKIMTICGVIILSVLASTSMILFIVSFFKTSNAFAAASMVIGTLIGFLAGIYIPIGNFPEYIQTGIKLFPISHTASLFRQILMEVPMAESFASAPVELKESFQIEMGVYYTFNSQPVSALFSVVYLIITVIIFFILAFLNMKRKNS